MVRNRAGPRSSRPAEPVPCRRAVQPRAGETLCPAPEATKPEVAGVGEPLRRRRASIRWLSRCWPGTRRTCRDGTPAPSDPLAMAAAAQGAICRPGRAQSDYKRRGRLTQAGPSLARGLPGWMYRAACRKAKRRGKPRPSGPVRSGNVVEPRSGFNDVSTSHGLPAGAEACPGAWLSDMPLDTSSLGNDRASDGPAWVSRSLGS